MSGNNTLGTKDKTPDLICKLNSLNLDVKLTCISLLQRPMNRYVNCRTRSLVKRKSNITCRRISLWNTGQRKKSFKRLKTWIQYWDRMLPYKSSVMHWFITVRSYEDITCQLKDRRVKSNRTLLTLKVKYLSSGKNTRICYRRGKTRTMNVMATSLF